MNIRVDFNYPIQDGTEVVFRSPVDCSQVTGLKVYYGNVSKEFVFADAHGNNVGDIDHLFAENVVVKVILDVTTGMAFVQNADTNAYLEGKFATKLPLPATAQVGQLIKISAVDAEGKVTATEAVTGGTGEGGSADLSAYSTTEQVQEMIDTAISNIPDYDGEMDDVYNGEVEDV